MKAFLKNYRQSPRKVRLVADLIRGKNVADASVQLDFLVKRASDPMKKLLNSAVANAKQMGIDTESLFVKEVRVDKGIVMKRMMPRAMGRASRINKRTSHVFLALDQRAPKIKKAKKIEDSKESAKDTQKEVVAKKKVTKKVTKVTKDKEEVK